MGVGGGINGGLRDTVAQSACGEDGGGNGLYEGF